MPASYPGTVKVFTTKIDLVDTVFAAHINDLQAEMVAVQTILGLSPQGTAAGATTVADRIGALESGYMSQNRSETVRGTKTFTDEVVGNSGAHLVDHLLLTSSGLNLRMDSQGVRAQSAADSSAVDLNLQASGGRVLIGGKSAWHSGNDGPGSGLDADLLDGQHGSFYSPTTHTHAFPGEWSGIPNTSGYVQVNYNAGFTSLGYTPRYIGCFVTFPTAGVTYAPLIQGIPNITDTYFTTRWINQRDGSPFFSPMTFIYLVWK